MVNENPCDNITQLLPWRLNDTLPEGEARAVDEHLAVCGACREEWQQTLEAGEIFDAHPSADDLTALAWDEEPAGVTRPLLEAHLATCELCREALELARLSRRQADADDAVPARPPVSPHWRSLAMAASLVAAVGLTGWLVSWQGQSSLRAPTPNTVLAELFPTELVKRGGEPATKVMVPAASRQLTLVLASQEAGGAGPYRLKLLDDAGRLRWSTAELLRRPAGDFTVTLPVDVLADGAYELRVVARDDGPALETYAFKLVRGAGD